MAARQTPRAAVTVTCGRCGRWLAEITDRDEMDTMPPADATTHDRQLDRLLDPDGPAKGGPARSSPEWTAALEEITGPLRDPRAERPRAPSRLVNGGWRVEPWSGDIERSRAEFRCPCGAHPVVSAERLAAKVSAARNAGVRRVPIS